MFHWWTWWHFLKKQSRINDSLSASFAFISLVCRCKSSMPSPVGSVCVDMSTGSGLSHLFSSDMFEWSWFTTLGFTAIPGNFLDQALEIVFSQQTRLSLEVSWVDQCSLNREDAVRRSLLFGIQVEMRIWTFAKVWTNPS